MTPNVYLTSPVFFEIADHKKVSEKYANRIRKLQEELSKVGDLHVAGSRFPSGDEIAQFVKENEIDLVGCHLSHPITEETMNTPSLKGVSTSTAGFNHICLKEDVVTTHTPGVLDDTVADYTIAIILANLRNIIDLHSFLWNGNWTPDKKWDLDQELNNVIDNKKVGIVGLGEIGLEVAKRLLPWGLDIVYYDINRNKEMEEKYDNLSFQGDLEELFSQSDVVTLHVPLNKHKKGMVDETLLKKMKDDALLVNTARGPIVNFDDLIRLLENQKIAIDLSFDVWDPEPVSQEVLKKFKKIKREQPERRFVFMPHNASSDADTRAKMSIMILEDLISMASSKKAEDLKDLRFIPSQRKFSELDEDTRKELEQFRIAQWW